MGEGGRGREGGEGERGGGRGREGEGEREGGKEGYYDMIMYMEYLRKLIV